MMVRFVILFLLAFPALADTRICARTDTTVRSAAVLREFQMLYPCPSTGQPTGKCPGWQKDHVIPLACGGCDSVENLQWLPKEIKTCAGKLCKDRWERRVYRCPQ